MLRMIRSAAVLLAATAAVSAADPKPTLTPQQIAEGWVMLFDGETTFGWVIEGEAKIEGGEWIVGGAKPTVLTSTAHFGAVQYAFEARAERPPGGGLFLPLLPSAAVEFAGLQNVDATGTTRGISAPGPVRIDVPAGSVVRIRRLAVRPLGANPIFNGKDLTGWKVFAGDPKRSASQWSVTAAGELHVVNGPGDLQTDGKYADFILQFECKTNGMGLNSGVFFRCVPEQYQNGYEAQVQNSTLDGDRAKPKDFGTGAIYRRVPARRVVSNDREWFTMTVAANGAHISTWVNGFPVVDWTDNRKPADNPRQGLRTAAGHLSIQGHDPTTDILFRNLRVAELKK